LRKAFRKGKFFFHGELELLAQPATFESLCKKAGEVHWVVYAKRPFGGPEQVLKYLARYTHRVAISNRRLLSLRDGRVTFECKDQETANELDRVQGHRLSLVAIGVIHVFPLGFVHIRHFGFLSNRRRNVKLALCRSLLPARQTAVESSADSPTNRDSPAEEPMARLCPVCQVGRLMFVQALSGEVLDSLSTPTVADTS